MPKVETSSFNSESPYYSPKSSVQTIQVALVAITLVGGITATFALVGYLPSVAVWPGAIGGGGAFIAFVVITVKQCCKDDYDYLEGEIPETSRDLDKSVSKEKIGEASKQDKFFLDVSKDDYDFASENESEESSRSLESEPDEQLCDPFSFHNFVDELALKVLSCLDAKSLVAACGVNRQWRALASDEKLWKAISVYTSGKGSEQMLSLKQECLKAFQFRYEQKQNVLAEEDLFSDAISRVKNPSIMRIEMVTKPSGMFITDSFLVARIPRKASYLFRLSHEKANPLITKMQFAKIKGKPDQAIEIDLRGMYENEENHYQIAKLSNLNNKEFAALQRVRRKEYEREDFLHVGNYVYQVWISRHKTKRIIRRWDASTGKSLEITIPCRIKYQDFLASIVGIESLENQLVIAYDNSVREFWNLTTLEKEELKLETYKLPKAVRKELGLVWKLEAYRIFQSFEIMTGKCTPPTGGQVTFLFIRDFQKKKIVFYKAIPHSINKTYIYEDKVIFFSESGNIIQFDLKENELTTSEHQKWGYKPYFFLHCDKLIVGTSLGELTIWDLDSQKCLYRSQIFASKIDRIDAEGTKIAVSSRREVAILDFSIPDDIELISYH